MKRKLLLAALYAVSALGFHANAQKDVTSNYLKNADFSESAPTDEHIYGYGHDKNTYGGKYYGLQDVSGWSKEIVKGDDDNGNPGSAMAGGVFAYGSEWQLKGANVAAPAAKPDNNATDNCLGYFGVWGCGGYYYQEVTLQAGKYNMTVPTYNQVNPEQAGTSYTGFIADNGTKYVEAVNIATGSWQDIEIEFTLSEETKGRIALGYQSTGNGSGANPHLFFDCVKLTYTISYEIYSSIVDAAKAIQDKPMNKDVKSALDAALSQYGSLTTSDEAQFESAVEALGAATSAASASIKNYEDALAILNAAKSNSLDSDGQAAYADNETIAAIQAAYTAGTLEAVTEEQKTAAEQAFQSAIRAQGAGADMTLAINNWDFLNCQNGNFPGWTIQVTPAGAAKVKTSTQVEFWTTDANRSFDFYQTVTNLPVGKYTIQASMWYSKDKQNVEFDNNAGVYGSSSGNEVFKGVSTECTDNTECVTETTDEISVYDGTLRLGVKNNGTMGPRWFGVDWIKLTYVEPIELAAEAEYAALDAAIAAAEEHTLGFEAGEYAPYNNVEVLTLLATAKALDQEADNAKEYVNNVTETLNDADWKANPEEVNAIFDGSFEYEGYERSTSVQEQPIGWNRIDGNRGDGYNVRLQWDSTANPGLNATSSGNALFTKLAAYYGREEGYTMPLKANTYYKISFVYGGWGTFGNACSKDGYVTVTDPNGETIAIGASQRLPLDEVECEGDASRWKEYEAYFKTGDAGNYILGLRKDREISNEQSQYAYGDIVLKKADAPSVTVEVSAAGYATFSSVLPVDLSGVEAYAATNEAKEGVITLSKVEGVVAANTGLIIKNEGEYTLPYATEEGTSVEDNFLVPTGNGTGVQVEAGDYVFAVNNTTQEVGFYVVAESPATVQAGKAYLSADAVPATNAAKALRIVFGDETATAIETVATEAEADGVLYNVAGQQVGNDYKGIVIDKNGKKYLNK